MTAAGLEEQVAHLGIELKCHWWVLISQIPLAGVAVSEVAGWALWSPQLHFAAVWLAAKGVLVGEKVWVLEQAQPGEKLELVGLLACDTWAGLPA